MVKTCQTAEIVYKDVVIIGNGPSGITLSYMLAGHWPYWTPDKVEKHPDELLRARLTYADCNKSLIEQNLVDLAEGLEGRSTNPVSLLWDSLQNPCADLGMQVPSLLQYKYHPDKEIDHVVLGKGAPGGAWHRMDPNLRTLSLSAWMSLPGLDFNTWNEAHPENSTHTNRLKKRPILKSLMNNNNNYLSNKDQYNPKCKQCKRQPFSTNNSICRSTTTNSSKHSINNNNEGEALCCRHGLEIANMNENDTDNSNVVRTFNVKVTVNGDNTINSKIVPAQLPRRILSVKRQQSKEVQSRALVSRVAQYYESYVHEMGLDKYFRNDTVVTSVRPVHNCTVNRKAQWLVAGFKLKSGKPFTYICRNVVLANGASDLANRLGLPGEDQASSWIKHDLTQLETALISLSDKERTKLKPVVIVGAGLSAADAVTICRSSGINVIHVYRNRSAGLDKMLPENVYPEYHEVHKMMKDCVNTYDFYTPLPEHKIIEFSQSNNHTNENKITVQHLSTGEIRTFEISFCAILIGSRPDLRFLSHTSNPTTTNNLLCDDIYTDQDAYDEQHRQQQQQWSLLTKKITWLKNLCAKCKHLNLCERSRRNEGCKRIPCYQSQLKQCECFDNTNLINSHNNTNNKNNEISQYTNNNNVPVMSQAHDDVKTPKICTIDENLSAIGIGEDPSKPVECKSNPIAVDKFTNEVLRAPKGLFAMGPLVGDNFIRFISGGALAITATLYKEND